MTDDDPYPQGTRGLIVLLDIHDDEGATTDDDIDKLLHLLLYGLGLCGRGFPMVGGNMNGGGVSTMTAAF